MQKYGTTVSGKRFFKRGYSCEQFSYCVFASDEIIEEYEAAIPVERRQFLMDATFKICPFGKINQIFIIYIAYLDSVNILFSWHLNEKTVSVFIYLQHVVPFIYVLNAHVMQTSSMLWAQI